MAYVPPGFLSRKGKQRKGITTLDLAALAFSIREVNEDPGIGFDDAAETAMSAMRKMNKPFYVDPELLETGLWAANMLNESGKFKHPLNYTFDEWVNKILHGRGTFDKTYNIITWTKRKKENDRETE